MVAVERRAMGWTPISVLGPMGRSVADLCLLYATQIGQHDTDPLTFPIDGDAFAEPRYATDAAAAEALCRASSAAIVIAPATSRWSRALPGVAFRLNGRIDTHAAGIAIVNGVLARLLQRLCDRV